MSAEQLERAAEQLRRAGIDVAVVASPPNVTYLSGFEAPMPIGYMTEVVGWRPPVAILRASDGAGWLVVPDALVEAATAQSWFARVLTFETLGHDAPTDPETTFRTAVARAFAEADAGAGRVRLGLEPVAPSVVAEVIGREAPEAVVVDPSAALLAARRVKTPREIALLRAAVGVADAAQRRLVDVARAGAPIVDLVLWRDLVLAMEEHAGRLLTVQGALLTGERTAEVAGALPDGRLVERGDLALLDVSPRVDGYWADCCNVVVLGDEPDAEQRRWFTAAREAFEAGAEALRPGARCCDVAALVEAALRRHGLPMAHYAGHEVGCGVNEPPRLVPYDETVIEPGMVFAVEPGAYEGAGGRCGARAERMVLVTEDGPEILSAFAWGL